MNNKAVIVFSGGQDSTTILGKALHDGYKCDAIGFYYGQKHEVELRQAEKIAKALNVPYKVVDVREFGLLVAPKTALVDNERFARHGNDDVSAQSPLAHMPPGIPASFVPNRNALFLTLAHAYAQMVGADSVWTGVCQTDYSGYPDCRDLFVKSLEATLNLGYQTNIQIRTPLMWKTKADTFQMAEECGVLDLVIEESHTCYNGVRGIPGGYRSCGDQPKEFVAGGLHPWGHGCGECPACNLRALGWKYYQDSKKAA